MRILAIETSCDETGIAVLEGSGSFPASKVTTKAEALLSQAEKHAAFGGVFPALAKREHTATIVPLLEQALKDAGLLIEGSTNTEKHRDALENLFAHEAGLALGLTQFLSRIETPDLDAIAVTAGPGLEPALWVGVNTAKALSLVWNIPVMPINHMEGHFLAPIVASDVHKQTNLPVLGLLISGGHTEFVQMHEWFSYKVLGQTLDDAVGEAFDKAARLIGLSYPGGPAISKLAEKARESGLTSPWKLPRPMIGSGTLAMSFSGLKTALLYTVQSIETLTDETRMLLSLEFENAVSDVLVAKTRLALEQSDAQTLILGGGVSANTQIRRMIAALVTAEFSHVALHLPDPKITGDNAVMIGQAAMLHLLSGDLPKGGDIRADGNWVIGSAR